jgi:hypothetical protein
MVSFHKIWPSNRMKGMPRRCIALCNLLAQRVNYTSQVGANLGLPELKLNVVATKIFTYPRHTVRDRGTGNAVF